MPDEPVANYAVPTVEPERALVRVTGPLGEVAARVPLTEEQQAIVRQAIAESFNENDLFAAGPPEHSQAMIDRCRQAIEEHKTRGHKVPKETLAALASWQRAHRIAIRRQQLQAERDLLFPGCICLGYGGRYPTQGLVIMTPDGRLLTDPGWDTFRDPCACPLGQAAQARTRARKEELLAEDGERRLRKLWDDLKLPPGLGESITFTSHVDQDAMRRVIAWYEGEHYPVQGVIFIGPNQRGKTTTAYLLARRAISDGIGVIGMSLPDLIEKLIDTFRHDDQLKADPDQPAQATHQQLIKSLQDAPFLLLDDLGAEKLTDYVERALYQIVNARAEADPALKHRTVITTNLTPAELLDRYGPRLWGRFRGLCQRVRFSERMMGPAAQDIADLGDL